MLMDYKLLDPITRLTLLIQNNPQPVQLKPIQMITDTDDDSLNTLYRQLERINSIYQYERSSFKQTDYRKLMYDLAVRLNQAQKITDDDQITNWSGEYYPDMYRMLINTHDHGVYYLYLDHHFLKYDREHIAQYQNRLLIYQTATKNSDKFVHDILNQSRQLTFKPNLSAFDALKNFWLAQSDSKHQMKAISEISPALNQVLNHIIKDQHSKSVEGQTVSEAITYQDLLNFYQEVQAQKLTDKTQIVQKWLFNDNKTTQDVQAMLKILRLHTHYQIFAQSLQPVLTEFEAQHILRQFKKDKYFPDLNKLDIKIYPIKQPAKHYQNPNTQKPVQHFLGVHGTNSFSIPSILCDGFKTTKQLADDEEAKFQETGQSLGDGTYFARLDQASKALSYSNYQFNRQYLLISDISYQQPVIVHGYHRIDKDHDFVKAPGVGVRHDYDEFVAVHPQQQVNLKYLVEITKA